MLLMLGSVGMPELILIGLMLFTVIIPFWMIFQKAGYNGALCFLLFLPVINVFLIWYLAFSKWPSLSGREAKSKI